MLAPDPELRPDAKGVTSHPLFWDNERAMRQTVALHARSASCQTEMGILLNNVATEALLGGSSGGNSERGALLAAASMDLTDWQRLVDPRIMTRITKHLVTGGEGRRGGGGGGGVAADSVQPERGGGGTGGNFSKADVGRKPYGNGFADLLRFCRNAYEHPPTGDEIEPIVAALVEASLAVEHSAAVAAAAAATKAKYRYSVGGTGAEKGYRRRYTGGYTVNTQSEEEGEEDGDDVARSNGYPRLEDPSSSSSSADAEYPPSSAAAGAFAVDTKRGVGTKKSFETKNGGTRVRDSRFYSLLPQGVVPGMAYRRLTRKQRRALLASYLLHLLPGLPLAVHECALAAGPDGSGDAPAERGGRAGGSGEAKRGGGGSGPRRSIDSTASNAKPFRAR